MKRKRLKQYSLAEIRAFEADQLDNEHFFERNHQKQWIQKLSDISLRSKRDNEKSTRSK